MGQVQLHSYSVVTQCVNEGYMKTVGFCLLQKEAYTWDSKTYCQVLWLMAITVDCYERGNILIYFGISENR